MRPFLTTAMASFLLLGVLQTPTAEAEPDPASSDTTSSDAATSAVWPLDPDPPDLTTHGSWPLDPEPPVMNGFDLPGARWEAGHRGVDLLGRPAQPVLAPLAGTVSYVGRIAGRGVVTLSHGETRTTYEPVLSDLRVGDAVAAGEPLGWLHPTGSHCTPQSCLHWGWRRGSEYLDPMTMVGRTRIRLLPLWGARQPSVGRPDDLFRPEGAPGRRPS